MSQIMATNQLCADHSTIALAYFSCILYWKESLKVHLMLQKVAASCGRIIENTKEDIGVTKQTVPMMLWINVMIKTQHCVGSL